MEKITHIVFDHDGTLVDTTKVKHSMYPGIHDLLKFLKNKNIQMYVWTARGKQSTVQILTELNIYGHFEDVCGFDCAERKPSVAGIEYLLPEVDPNKVIVIGDSLGDIIGGKKFGAYCIGAMWAHGEAGAAETYAEYGASASFLSVEECQKHIEKLIE